MLRPGETTGGLHAVALSRPVRRGPEHSDCGTGPSARSVDGRLWQVIPSTSCSSAASALLQKPGVLRFRESHSCAKRKSNAVGVVSSAHLTYWRIGVEHPYCATERETPQRAPGPRPSFSP